MAWPKEELRRKYEEYFPDEQAKARAFDKIAERYYCANFGTMSKSDFETLLFSIYLEQILDRDESDFTKYSDYTLSKLLGVTQSKISSLKVKKELLYPYEKFNWRESFKRISNRAVYENEKIKLLIPDRNLYLELKNAIETRGGYVEVQLTANLLQVPLSYFLDLMVVISEDETDVQKIWDVLKSKIQDNGHFKEEESFGKVLRRVAPEMAIGLIGECIPYIGGTVSVIAQNIYRAIKG